ncbi:STAS domain-containing protein [Solirubrobacter sp. CPCC 204708]|uniref:Anti-sigma factor antagonist n=1 Tax=Solirubrobacter deserti TaxID=2282478 RepID=A0ABT4RJU7_9ACTN|nr:STAS domain-containing protein [Solirubrobacter deserti]MBE2315831.1 STAS domain-containing protein [Solirubrobacter deserti]MDA0138833.1 STAS domain-containing protein [Solirubrobacter deserti]
MSATSNHLVATRVAITRHQLGEVPVLEVGGELDLWTAPELCSRIEECLEACNQGVVVDLAPLQFCDSTGLRALAGVAQEARVAQTRLIMLRPSKKGVCRAFELAGASEFLPLVDDAEAARKLLNA